MLTIIVVLLICYAVFMTLSEDAKDRTYFTALFAATLAIMLVLAALFIHHF